MAVTIRRIRPKETGQAVAMIQGEIYPGLSIAEMGRWKRRGSGKIPYTQFFVAEEDEGLIGVIGWILHDVYGDRIILMQSWVAVKEECRRKGIGKELWQRSLEMVKRYWGRRGKKLAMVFVQTDESNQGSIAFYESIYPSSQKTVIPDAWGSGNGIIFYFQRFGEE